MAWSYRNFYQQHYDGHRLQQLLCRRSTVTSLNCGNDELIISLSPTGLVQASNSSQLSLAYPVLPAPAHCEPDTKDSHYQPASNEYLIILTLYLLLIKEVTLLHR